MPIKQLPAPASVPRGRRIFLGKEGWTDKKILLTGVEEFKIHGFVIIENAIAIDTIERFRKQMLADTATYLAQPNPIFNHGVENSNISITPPLSAEFFDEDFWANRHAAAMMEYIIGPRPFLCWASSNISLPSNRGARQAVHTDAYVNTLDIPYGVEIDIYLQDTDRDNGTMEIWPGTQVFKEDTHIKNGRGWITQKNFCNRAEIFPPTHPTIRQGSIIMRDLRVWKCAMPNTSQDPSIMVKLLYFPRWFRPHMRLTLPTDVSPILESWLQIDMVTNTDFVNGPVDHVATKFPINFTRDWTKGLVKYHKYLDAKQGRKDSVIRVTKNNYWDPPTHSTRAKTKRSKCWYEPEPATPWPLPSSNILGPKAPEAQRRRKVTRLDVDRAFVPRTVEGDTPSSVYRAPVARMVPESSQSNVYRAPVAQMVAESARSSVYKAPVAQMAEERPSSNIYRAPVAQMAPEPSQSNVYRAPVARMVPEPIHFTIYRAPVARMVEEPAASSKYEAQWAPVDGEHSRSNLHRAPEARMVEEPCDRHKRPKSEEKDSPPGSYSPPRKHPRTLPR